MLKFVAISVGAEGGVEKNIPATFAVHFEKDFLELDAEIRQ